jgi:hypothetical protein
MTRRAFAALALLAALGGNAAAEPLAFEPLELINGWASFADTYRPGIAIDSNGVVYLRGVMGQQSGSNLLAFVLPQKYRPQGLVYAPVALVSGRPGRLLIEPNGNVRIRSAALDSEAQILTSLDGVTYSRR